MSEIIKEPRDTFTGKRGETIVRGDLVAAAVNQGNTCTLKIGTVQDIYYQQTPQPWNQGYRVVIQFQGGSNVSTLHHTHRITKLEPAEEKYPDGR